MLRAAIVDAVAQQLDNAIEQLEKTGAENTTDKEAAVAVHEARKSLKRVRATLRLLRRALGEAGFKRESQCFAGVGRLLSDTREAQVMDQVLRDLARLCRPAPADTAETSADSATAVDSTAALPTKTPAVPWPDAVRAGYAEAVALAQQVRKEGPKISTRPSPELRAQVLEELQGARARLTHWLLRGKAKRSLKSGLRRAVRQARSMLKEAFAASPPEETAERFHELRKRVKDLYYMSCLLAPAQPALLEPLAAKLDELADLLGDDHDLAVLAAQAHAVPDRFGGTMAVSLLLELGAARQQTLRQTAQPLAESLNELRPRSFARAIAQGLLPRRL